MADGTADGADGAADRVADGCQTIRRDVDGAALEPAEVLGPLAHDEEERERHVEPEGPAHEGDAVRVGGAELDQILDQVLDLRVKVSVCDSNGQGRRGWTDILSGVSYFLFTCVF